MVKTRSDIRKQSIESNITAEKDISLKSSLDHNNISEINFPIKKASGSTSDKKGNKNSSGLIESSAITSKRKTTKLNESLKQSQYNKLFGNLSLKNPNINKLARFYYNAYNKNNHSGLCHFIQLFFDLSNCKFNTTKKMITHADPSSFINKIDGGAKGLTNIFISDTQSKLFKSNFISFIEELFNLAKNDIIYDGLFCETLILWLKCFSESSIRSFRFSSTLFLCTMVDALIKIYNGLKRSLASKPSLTNSKSSTSVLNKSFILIENHSLSIEELIEAIVTGVISSRYRDVLAEIRKMCIYALGEWIRNCGTIFLKNENLKFIGWMLNDRINSVRLKAAQTFLKIIETCEISKLSTFINRFKERLCEMCYDISDEIGCVSLQIIILLHSKNVKISLPKINKIILLVYSDSFKVARNAARFLIQYIQSKHQSDDNEFNLTQDLIQFHLENNINDNTDNFISSIINQTQETVPNVFLTSISNLLDEDFGDEYETIIIKILFSFIKYINSKQKQSKSREKENSNDGKSKLSISNDVFTAYLLKWLEKFSNESNKICMIIPLCKYLQFDAINSETIFSILGHLSQIILKSKDSFVIQECACIFEFFQISLPLYATNIKNSIRSLIQNSIVLFKNNEENLELFSSGLIKLSAISKFIDITEFDTKEILEILLTTDILLNNKAIIENGLVFSFLYIGWDYVNLKSESTNIPLAHINLRQQFLQKLVSVYEQSSLNFKRICFRILCDFSSIHSQQIHDDISIKNDFIMINSIISEYFNQISSSEEQENDLKNDILPMIKLVHYKILTPETSSLIFHFLIKNYKSINKILIDTFILISKNDIGYFFNLFFLFIKKEFKQVIYEENAQHLLKELVHDIPKHLESISTNEEYQKFTIKFIEKGIEYSFSNLNVDEITDNIYLKFLDIISCFPLFTKYVIRLEIFDCLVSKILNKSIANNENIHRFVAYLNLKQEYQDFYKKLNEESDNNKHADLINLLNSDGLINDSIDHVKNLKTDENQIHLNPTIKDELPRRVRKRPTGIKVLYETDQIDG